MRNYIFDFEQIVLKERFFADPEQFFEDARVNTKYFFYKAFKDFSRECGIDSDLELENIVARTDLFQDYIGLITLRGFAYGVKNCCCHLYFLYNFLTGKAWFCFSSPDMEISEGTASGPAFFIVKNPKMVEYFETKFDKNFKKQFKNEVEFFTGAFTA